MQVYSKTDRRMHKILLDSMYYIQGFKVPIWKEKKSRNIVCVKYTHIREGRITTIVSLVAHTFLFISSSLLLYLYIFDLKSKKKCVYAFEWYNNNAQIV